MSQSTVERFMQHRSNRRLFEEERLFVDATELLCNIMESTGLKRNELAERLGTSKAFVTQILRGNKNLTLKTLADLFFALNHRLLMAAEPMTASAGFVVVRPWNQTQRVGNVVIEPEEARDEEFAGGIAA
jgi:transcriptional regulator with XRE-family HTH domain